jgi:CubicO group peptidase (beta-lactamase class C family)
MLCRFFLLAALLCPALLPGVHFSSIAAAENPPSPGPFAPVLQSLVDHHVVAGVVVLVANREKVLDVEAAGFSSLEKRTPMRTDALFWIASMTKSLTGTALMMLVDEGKLSLDDPVEKYLPEFKGQMVEQAGIEMHPPRHPITVREVMDHTSGLVTPQHPSLKRAYTLKENVEQFAKLPLQWEPGTKFQYNNCGINTGARVLEVVSGVPYAEFMQRQLFTPLEMKETTFWPSGELADRLASSTKLKVDKSGMEDIALNKNLTPAGISKFSQGVAVPTPMLVNFGMGPLFDYGNHFAEAAGGLFSTAGDIGRFCQMLLNGGEWQSRRYLSAGTVRQMSAIQTGDAPVNPQEGYGVGWFVKKKADEGPAIGSFGHRGARKTVMWIDPEDGLVMVLMVQCWEIRGDQQKELYESFMKAAVEKYGRRR